MKYKTSITLSKSGHYTTTVYAVYPDGYKQVVFKQGKLAHKLQALKLAKEYIAGRQ